MEDLPAGDYEIVAMFDADKGVEAADTSYRRPRLASYRQPSGGKLITLLLYFIIHKQVAF